MKIELLPGTRHSISSVGIVKKKPLKCSFKPSKVAKGKSLTVVIRPGKQGKARCALRQER